MAILALFVAAAWPCAGLVHEVGATAEADANDVVFDVGDGTVTVTYATTFAGDATSVGWIVPIFGAFVSVEDADVSTFDDLRYPTAPTVVYTRDGGGGCFLLPMKGGDLGDRNGIDVIAHGFTGTYEYVALSAASAADVGTWITDNGWAWSDSEALVQAYLDEDRDLVLVRVASTPGDDPARGLPPVAITYEGDALVYPARMALGSESPDQTASIFVRGAGRASESGWGVVEGGALDGVRGESPAVAWDRVRREAGDQRSLLLTWAGELDGAFVTRFDMVAPTASQDVDMVFSIGPDVTPLATVITVPGRRPEPEEGLVLLLPIAAWWRRRGSVSASPTA